MTEAKVEMATRVRFDYEKANLYRVVHVDGAHGGIAPGGTHVVMSLYSERRPIPQKEAYDIKNGTLERDSAASVSRDCDVLREVEVTAIMDFSTVKALHQWLGDKLDEFQKVQKALREKLAESGEQHE